MSDTAPADGDVPVWDATLGTYRPGTLSTAHARSHDHSASADGATLNPGTLNLPGTATPAPTAEGQVNWDTDDNKLVVGDGATTKHFVPTASVSGDATMSTAGVVTVAGAHSGSAHHAQAHANSNHTGAGAERAFVLGIADSIPVATSQFADFPVIAPHAGTLLRMKAIVKAAVTETKTIRLRKATAAGGYTDWADVTGFVVSLTVAANGGFVEVVSPAQVAFAEGDAFQLETEDANAASGTNLAVEVIYTPT